MFIRLILGLVLAAAMAPSAFAEKYSDRQYSIKVFDQQAGKETSSDSVVESGVLAFVYTAGTKTLATIYKNSQRTALANPITRASFASSRGVNFYGTANSYDIYVAHSDGTVGYFPGVTYSQHSVSIDRAQAAKHLVIPFGVSDNAEVDTGIDLPYGALVHDAFVNVVTIDADETINVGLLSSETAGDADAFLAAVSVATQGIPQNVAYTTGSNETYLSAVTFGAKLALFSLGNDVATDVGGMSRIRHSVTGANAKSVTYTGSAGSDTAAGYIHLLFNVVR